MGHLIENIIIEQSSFAEVVTKTTMWSKAIDMRDAEGVLAIAFGSSGSRGTTAKPWVMHLQGASDTGATFKNIGSTSACQTAVKTKNSITDSIMALDTLHPGKNFVRVGINQTSGLCTRVGIIKYGLRKRGSSGINADATKFGALAMVINSCST